MGTPVRISFSTCNLSPSVELSPAFSQEIAEKVSGRLQEMGEILGRLIPKGVCFNDERAFVHWLQRELPCVYSEGAESPSGLVSITCLSRLSGAFVEEGAFLKFIKNSLYPQGRLCVFSCRQFQFFLPHISFERFILAEITMTLNQPEEIFAVKNNVHKLAKEMAKHASSSKQVIHMPSLPHHEDVPRLRDLFIKVLRKWPSYLEDGALRDFYRFLILTEKEFRNCRPSHHLIRIICSHYLMQKEVARAARFAPHQPHLSARLLQTQLIYSFGTSSVLALIVAVALPDPGDCLESPHLLSAVQQFCPKAQIVHRSFYLNHKPDDAVRLIYLEFEKKGGAGFFSEEIASLKENLEEELKRRVERRRPSLFKARNEEEVVKNLLRLKQELRYVSDIPQIMIFFEDQTSSTLVFTILVARVIKKNTQPLNVCLDLLSPEAEWFPDWVRRMGSLHKYPIEAQVFRLQIAKESSLLMANSSVNFYRARQRVLGLLTKALGEVRDYNGGLISEQDRLLSALKRRFILLEKQNPDILESFFFSLYPIEAQFTLPISSIARLFHTFLGSLSQPLIRREDFVLSSVQHRSFVFISVRMHSSSFQNFIVQNMPEVYMEKIAVSAIFNYQGASCFNYIYKDSDAARRETFCEEMTKILQKWQEKIQSMQVLRLTLPTLPPSLDPRLNGDHQVEMVVRMLYDGLMRLGKDGLLIPAIARSFEISDDQKVYTFHLKNTFWSDGSEVTACDFAYAWKKTLSPHFLAPFAYLLYPIKNARAIKEGNLPAEFLGVIAKDKSTLIVELEYSAPYFLELTSHPVYAPVNERVEQLRPHWSTQEGSSYVCNGPFILERAGVSQGYKLVKNSLYWDRDSVHLGQVVVSRAHHETAWEMFQKDEVDWVGVPIGPSTNPSVQPEDAKILSNFVCWGACNTARFPFHHKKIRQALAYAVDRKKIINSLGYRGLPAVSPLPLIHAQYEGEGLRDGDIKSAVRLFQEALDELGLEREKFPIFTFVYSGREIVAQIVRQIQQQWKEVLGVQCVMEELDWPTLFSRMTRGDYQVGTIGWIALIDDPLYTLTGFISSKMMVNFAKWEHPAFQDVVEAAIQESDPTRRAEYLVQAERILIDEMPVIPLFHDISPYRKKEHLKDVRISKLGRLDFKWAYISNSG